MPVILSNAGKDKYKNTGETTVSYTRHTFEDWILHRELYRCIGSFKNMGIALFYKIDESHKYWGAYIVIIADK